MSSLDILQETCLFSRGPVHENYPTRLLISMDALSTAIPPPPSPFIDRERQGTKREIRVSTPIGAFSPLSSSVAACFIAPANKSLREKLFHLATIPRCHRRRGKFPRWRRRRRPFEPLYCLDFLARQFSARVSRVFFHSNRSVNSVPPCHDQFDPMFIATFRPAVIPPSLRLGLDPVRT